MGNSGFYRDLPARSKFDLLCREDLSSHYDVGLVGRVRGSAASPEELVRHEGLEGI